MPTVPSTRCYLLLSLLILISNNAYAESEPNLIGKEQKYNTGWLLNLDNDILAESDRDYTGGIALTLSGSRAQEYLISLEGVRNWLDDLLRVNNLYAKRPHFQLHSVQYGVMLFTPGDITDPAPIFDDRPYGSLFYISNTELTVAPANDKAWLSTLTFGLLGLNAAEYIQEAIHAVTNSDVANGWDNQISSGGEPTLMYTLSAQHNHIDTESTASSYQFKTAYEANAGFSTDVNASLSWRWGRIHTPWWSFNHQHSEYIQLGAPVVAGNKLADKGELYVWAGTSVKYRFYSSLLQGQFFLPRLQQRIQRPECTLPGVGRPDYQQGLLSLRKSGLIFTQVHERAQHIPCNTDILLAAYFGTLALNFFTQTGRND